ncbi:NRAMP family divalent metal transporter [Sphingomonas paucimobilis]|uniref:NRAMP family divalent metal transporter n=1 Tax=Sphingomonas paucimobilis TaxID=13689 RepID=UPI0030F7F130
MTDYLAMTAAPPGGRAVRFTGLAPQTMAVSNAEPRASAHLDEAHVGDIQGAFGTIKLTDPDGSTSLWRRVLIFLAIVGPGLIVMVGDNDAGAFGTYTQAGQMYGTSLLWTLLLLVPVLYVNQEMVLRLGVVTGVGHARLIFERFGRFWGAFSVIDLFLLNALTIVTEFIGVSLGLDYLGVPKLWGVLTAAAVTIAAASTGDFRRFERFMMVLVGGSLLLAPIVIALHPGAGEIARGFFVPGVPTGSKLSEVMLLIIAIVGTTVAPWQLFFQQSYVIDKRITPKFIGYEKADLWIGIAIVVAGAAAMMAFTSVAFQGTSEFGHFVDAKAIAVGIEHKAGRIMGVLFALALIDASIIGASAVSLATAYALGDMLSLKHSLHRKVSDAPVFFLVYAGLIAVAAAIVLTPGAPLGLLTNAVQTLAGVLLPSATVFLLLLCNDKAVLGPWVNGRWLNLFTSVVIAALVMLSIILTSSVLYPAMSAGAMLAILGGGAIVTAIGCMAMFLRKGERIDRTGRGTWQMPSLDRLEPSRMSGARRLWMGVLRLYLLVAGGLVLVRIVQLALNRPAMGGV